VCILTFYNVNFEINVYIKIKNSPEVEFICHSISIPPKSLKRRIFAKIQKLSPHATNGALWCQKIPEKWSSCSPCVARGSKVQMREKRRTMKAGLSQLFTLFFRFVFKNVIS
jgi:hypothetical protein